ncbi:MAG TPA: FKBP-type peptidyl-prolyl cis-trans isomerase [Sediminibacterium sp.]|nr:FKBP-type peptidyl-prolyl cis-trans isomerase [Sediminibacterium sp.]
MRKSLLFSVVFAMLCSGLYAQKKPAAKTAADLREDTIQYSLGVYMMQQFFEKSGFSVTNPTLFKKAIDDVLAKRKLMVDPATTESRLLAYQSDFLKAKGIREEQLLFQKVKADKKFEALPSGVYYMMIKNGTGLRPSAKDTVVLNVICTLPSGKVVDNTNETKRSYMAIAGEMIPGIKDVLFRMPEGSVVRAVIPASSAYGEAGTQTIPPNSAVIYDLALVQVKPAK